MYVGQAVEILGKMPSVTPIAPVLASIQSIASAVGKIVYTRKRQLPLPPEASGIERSAAADESAPGGERESEPDLGGLASADHESFMSYLSQADLGALVTDPFDTALFWQ